jgi:hypothetical protein
VVEIYSSGVLRRFDWQLVTDVVKDPIVFILRAKQSDFTMKTETVRFFASPVTAIVEGITKKVIIVEPT